MSSMLASCIISPTGYKNKVKFLFGSRAISLLVKYHAGYITEVHDKNKLARIYKIFVPLFSRECEPFHNIKFVIPFWNYQ